MYSWDSSVSIVLFARLVRGKRPDRRRGPQNLCEHWYILMWLLSYRDVKPVNSIQCQD
jgi:hypothetical protein